MSVKKIVSLFLVLMMLCSLVTPVIAIKIAENSPIPVTEESKLHKDVEIIEIDPNLENLTPYWIIIAVGSEEKGKLATFKYIDSSKSLKDYEKEELKRFLQELWKKYPVKTIKDKNSTLITLESRTEIVLTEKDKIMLERVAMAVNEYFSSKYEIGILWNVDTHQSIAFISCKKWGESDYYCGISRDHADDPDYWTQIPPPPGYPDWFWKFIMQVVHSWTHYYNPDLATGSAPSECKYYANVAKSKYSSGDKYSAFQNLGYASHFINDVGNPLHTGAELRQIVLSALRFGDLKYIHFAYEGYVSSNWNSGYSFKSIVESNWYYYPIIDPEKATKDLATYAHQYADTIVWTIFTNPDTWQNDQNLRKITENCLLETAKYSLGLVKYVRG